MIKQESTAKTKNGELEAEKIDIIGLRATRKGNQGPNEKKTEQINLLLVIHLYCKEEKEKEKRFSSRKKKITCYLI